MRQYYEDDEPRRYRGEERYESGRRGRREERGFMDRAADEVKSWFGDEDAERRRRMEDHERGGEWRGRPGDRDWGGDERGWARQWGYVEGRPRSERGEGERGWTDRERAWSETGAGAGAPERFWGERRAESGAWGGRPESGWPRGRYTGRGPRGYQRSDERIKEDVCELLALHGDVDATDIEVTVTSAEVTLGGRVNRRWEKRIAEDLAESVWGTKDVHNQIRVSQGEPGPPGETGQPWRTRAA
jgi:osmotically-inducible protein OsmY